MIPQYLTNHPDTSFLQHFYCPFLLMQNSSCYYLSYVDPVSSVWINKDITCYHWHISTCINKWKKKKSASPDVQSVSLYTRWCSWTDLKSRSLTPHTVPLLHTLTFTTNSSLQLQRSEGASIEGQGEKDEPRRYLPAFCPQNQHINKERMVNV